MDETSTQNQMEIEKMNQISGETRDLSTFEGVKGCRLYYKAWMPEVKPKAVMAIVHGVGEHIERYKNFVDALPASGYSVIGYDQRGHGNSGGQRGHIHSWEEYRGDLRIFLGVVKNLAPGLPVFLYGHSMGSLVVLDYLLRSPEGLSGAILSGTALLPTQAAPPFLVLVAKTLSGVYPAFSMKVTLEGKSLSRDPEVAKAYMEDPLVHWQRSARWGTESLDVIEWINSHPTQVNLPILFVHGECDPLVSAEGARRFFEQVSYPDKTLRIYPECLHEPHNDLDYKQVISDIIGWMDAHIH